MKIYYIYKATNKINGKVYIGKTYDFLKRKEEHLKDRRGNSIFHRAIDKYGADNFEWEIVDSTTQSERINLLEKYYIQQYDSYKSNGYNMTKGGDGGSMWNARPVVCLTLKGQYVKRYDSAMQAEQDGYCNSSVLMSCKNLQYTVNGHMFMFEDDYMKFGAKKCCKPESASRKPVIQCDLNGNFIKKYKSVAEAAIQTGTSRTSISGVLTNRYRTANGYIFVYEKDFPVKNVSAHIYKKSGRKIAQLNPETDDVIEVFDRIVDAGKKLGVSYKAIHKVIDTPDRTAYGYKWISQ